MADSDQTYKKPSEPLFRVEVYRCAVPYAEVARRPNFVATLRETVRQYLVNMGVEPHKVLVADCNDMDNANKQFFEAIVYADVTELGRLQIEIAGGILLE